jgi:D-alanine--poly(phosphoribitol) ligase subunit 2
MKKKEIIDLILNAITDLNQQFPQQQPIEAKADAILFGRGSKLDSLGLVNLIFLVEEKVLEKYDKAITLADERAMSLKSSPFHTVDTLAEYILTLLKE